MPSRLVALLLAAPALTALVLVPACAGGPGGGGVAFSVDDHEFSNDELYDELRALDSNELFRTALQVQELAEPHGDAADSYTQAYTRYVIELRVFFTLVEDEFTRRGLELDDQALEDAEASFRYEAFEEGQPRVYEGDEVLAPFSDRYAAQWVADQARLNLLQSSFTSIDEFGQFVTDAATNADVSVNSRYGSWDSETLTIEPPAGPLSPSTTAAPGF